MTPRRKARRSRGTKRNQLDVLDDLKRALDDADELVLAVELGAFLEDRLRRAAGRDAINRIRTSVQKLDQSTLRHMPEVVADDIAGIRNLAIYEYLEDADELVYRTLSNGVPSWKDGVQRARRALIGDDLPSPVPTRADGSLTAARPRTLCGKPVKATGRPCLLKRGHRGRCRSKLG